MENKDTFTVKQIEGYVFAWEAFKSRTLNREELAAMLTMLAAVAPEGGAYDKVWIEGPNGEQLRFDLHRGERYTAEDL